LPSRVRARDPTKPQLLRLFRVAFETAIGIAVANYPALRCDGHSFAVDAYGGIIVLADASPGLVLATFDLAAIRRTRDEERFRWQI
jgi:deaminated glutathione amidase